MVTSLVHTTPEPIKDVPNVTGSFGTLLDESEVTSFFYRRQTGNIVSLVRHNF